MIMRALNIKWDTDGNTDVLNELPNESRNSLWYRRG